MRSRVARSAGRPRIWIVPESAPRMSMIMRSVVVLPAPLGPSRPKTLSRGIATERSLTATWPAKDLVTPESWMALSLNCVIIGPTMSSVRDAGGGSGGAEAPSQLDSEREFIPRERDDAKGLFYVVVSTVAYGSLPILGKLAFAAGVRTTGRLPARGGARARGGLHLRRLCDAGQPLRGRHPVRDRVSSRDAGLRRDLPAAGAPEGRAVAASLSGFVGSRRLRGRRLHGRADPRVPGRSGPHRAGPGSRSQLAGGAGDDRARGGRAARAHRPAAVGRGGLDPRGRAPAEPGGAAPDGPCVRFSSPPRCGVIDRPP